MRQVVGVTDRGEWGFGGGRSEARTRQRMQTEDGDRQEGPSSRRKKS